MITRFYLRLETQTILAAVAALLCLAAGYLFSFEPAMLIGWQSLTLGLVAGVGLSLIRLFGKVILSRFRIRRDQPEFGSNIDRAGMIIATGGAEEVLLRGYIFAPLTGLLGSIGAHLLNCGLSLALYSRKGAIRWEILPEALYLALLYQSSRSLFLVVTSRIVGETLWELFRDHPLVTKVLKITK
jgi:hypothetical protein